MKSAVIGTGVISEQHLAFLAERRSVEVVGVCDLSPIAGRSTAERFGGARAFTDFREMLDAVRPEVVHVLTPPASHRSMVTECLERGCHVLCEKPMALETAVMASLFELADRCGRRLMENHNYRFNEPVIEMGREVDAGRIGQVREVEVRMALGVRDGGRYADPNLPHPSHGLPAGVIHEFLTHLCYLALHFMGGFDRVEAVWSNHGREAAGASDPYTWDDLDALVMCGPVHGRIRFSAATKPDSFGITVRGTKGTLATDLFHPHLLRLVDRPGGAQLTPIVNHLVNGAGLMGAGLVNFGNKLMQRGPYEGLRRLLEAFYAAIESGGPMPVTAEQSLAAGRLIDALLAGQGATP